MGTSDLKVPLKTPLNDAQDLPSTACCVIVEYLCGGTLKQLFIKNRRKKLAYKVVALLALELSKGLRYLHSEKVVHDCKPENMLLDGNRNLKITNFGVVQVKAIIPSEMTGETGTLGYMTPDVLDGKPYIRRCDVYAFDIFSWEIYCCDMSYPNLSFTDVSSAAVHQNLRPEIPRCCSSVLSSLTLKFWDENPNKRPEMDEVVRMPKALHTSKGGGMIPEDQTTCCFYVFPKQGSLILEFFIIM